MNKAPPASSPAVAMRMRATKGRDTALELSVRCRVRQLGLAGYRVDARPDPSINRRADIVFARHRVAVFLDGCYWHGCPAHSRPPMANAGYWGPKLLANRLRDRDTTEKLRAAGWAVLRFWEHEGADGGAIIAARINQALNAMAHRAGRARA